MVKALGWNFLVKYLKNLETFSILCIFVIGIVGSGHPMIRAKLAPPFPIYIGQELERASFMKKKTLEEVLLLFNKTWGDRYNYRHITPQVFKGASKEVPIECNKHGIFWMTPCDHYHHHGCPDCDHERKKNQSFMNANYCLALGNWMLIILLTQMNLAEKLIEIGMKC